MLRRHVSGDRDAFAMLFTRHRDRLWAVAVRTLGDPDEAADALQDAMISAFRQARGFRGDSAVTTWLHRIVVNACLDRMRRRAARPATSGLDESAMDSLAARPGGPGRGTDQTEAAETSMEVTAALHHLPPEQRAALVLVDMLGYPVADAATVLGVSAGTVKSRCARGRARLLPLLAHLRGGSPAPPAGPPEPKGRAAAWSREGGVRPERENRAGGDSTTRNRAPTGRVSPWEGGGEHRL